MGRKFLLGGLAAVVMALVALAALFAVSPGLVLGGGDDAKAVIRNAAGDQVGEAEITEDGSKVLIKVKVYDLPPGFHGFHVHTVGKCTPDFTAAGGHFNPGAGSHPGHAADLPVLLVNADGKAEARIVTDRFKVKDLLDADGSALVIHASPDNYANIPSRYGTPDEDTLKTGDAGARIACGVVQSDK